MSQAMDPAVLALREQQAAFLGALQSTAPLAASAAWCLDRDDKLRLGLAAYRGNAQANTNLALAIAYPTVAALVGEPGFSELAAQLRAQFPPLRGDLHCWGTELASLLAQHSTWSAWPYLADAARLDWAIHESAGAQDAALDAPSLQLLQNADPRQLALLLHPSVRLLSSSWPIVSIWQAHQAPSTSPEKPDAALERARIAIAAHQGEYALVARRPDTRTQVYAIDQPTWQWTADLLQGMSLGAALERLQVEHLDFDVSHWLSTALQEAWLERAIVL